MMINTDKYIYPKHGARLIRQLVRVALNVVILIPMCQIQIKCITMEETRADFLKQKLFTLYFALHVAAHNLTVKVTF